MGHLRDRALAEEDHALALVARTEPLPYGRGSNSWRLGLDTLRTGFAEKLVKGTSIANKGSNAAESSKRGAAVRDEHVRGRTDGGERAALNLKGRREKRAVPSRPTILVPLFRHGRMLLLSLASLILLSSIFAPIGFWPAAFVALVPWIVYVGGSEFAPRVYVHSFLLGGAFFLVNMQWMHHADWGGFIALALYQAAYFPVVACTLRHVVRRRRWPLAFTLPLVWTGCEMVRAVAISGFPWFFLSHGFYHVLSFIQISDLVGAYGVSFVVASVNGAVADVMFAWLATRGVAEERTPPGPPLVRGGEERGKGRSAVGSAMSSAVWSAAWSAVAGAVLVRRWSLAWALGLVLANLIYGGFRLHQDTIKPGPKIAVLQGDSLISLRGDETKDPEKRRTYFSMLEAAKETKADLYLLPETPWIMYLNQESRNLWPDHLRDFQKFRDFAIRNAAYLVTGSASREESLSDVATKERHYNSATVFHPDGREPDRYDKVHLVYFGETLPFRFGRLRFIYLWLNSFVPLSGPEGKHEYSLFPGDGFHVFEMTPASAAGKRYRFGIPICYEDVIPYVAREFVLGSGSTKQADFLLNISNDGWFGRGHQQWQHLAICVFRAVENRVGIARAVNTGISGFIDPRGRVYDLVETDAAKRWPRASGYRASTLYVDSRTTAYSRFGDWFGWLCAAAWAAIFVDYWITRARTA